MKIGILSFRSKDPEPAVEDLKLVQAAQEIGYEAVLIPTWECSIEYGEEETVLWKGKPFPALDLLIPRARFIYYSELNLHLLELLEQRYPTLNKTTGVALAKNKIKTLHELFAVGLPQPRSTVIEDKSCLKQAADQVGGYPLVIKAPYGTFGMGVHLANTKEEAEEILYTYERKHLWPHAIVQEFIKEAEGKDSRLFVIGGKVVAAMERVAQEGEFRSNVELGATARVVHPSDGMQTLAVRAVEALGLDYAGVDIVSSARGPLILEVNANAGFKTLEEVSGVNIARTLIEHAVQRLR